MKADSEMLVTESGMVNAPVKPVQSEKADEGTVVMALGRVRPVKPEHPENVYEPIDVIVFGIVRLPVKPEHPMNVPLPTDVIVLGRLSEPVKPEQPENAEAPVVFTPSLMVRLFLNPLQF